MHIPDGILSLPVSAGAGAAAATALVWAARRAAKEDRRRIVPLAGITGAFVFAAQMVQIPVAAGTSGHVLGGALVAILLGPAPAVLVMSAVLVVQCLLFQDGGLLALGANILNMAVLGPVVATGVFLLLRPTSTARATAAAALAGWTSTFLAGSAAGLELGLSGKLPLGPTLAAMAGAHALIGLLEGAVTAAVVLALDKRGIRPALMGNPPEPNRGLVAAGAILSLVLALILAQWSSSLPDGLEATLRRFGLEPGTGPFRAPMPDYGLPSVPGWLGAAAAALLGLVGVGLLSWLLVGLVTGHAAGDQEAK